ncbi:MAG: LPS export ABC transporter periplasmic protein LptC [Acidobacteria bacterium]|nr:LPS export ABC transporter periplasmic protein LptC [Acidobacteriota bacterium]
MRWQQRLRIGIAIFGVGFLVVLWYAVRAPAPREQAREKVERMDRSATAESTSGEVRRLGGKDENAWVEYDRMLAYPDGRQKLTGARAYSKKRGGRDFKVTANEADVSPNQDNVQMRGAVELATSDGLVAKTEEAAYSQSEGIVRAAGPMQFTRVRVSGSSVGMTYDEHRDFLWLLDQAVVKMAPETPADKARFRAGGSLRTL